MLSARRASAKAGPLPIRLALLAAILLLGDVASQATHAQYTAQAGNAGSPHAASVQALYWPGAFAVAPQAAAIAATATWSLASPEKGSGYAVLGYHGGPTSGAACPTAPTAYTYATSAANGTATATDSASEYISGAVAAYEGSYSCFAIQQWYTPGVAQSSWTGLTTPAWTSTNNPPAVLPVATYTNAATVPDGMFATSFSLANAAGGTVGRSDSGDTITINYSYATNAPSLGALMLCAHQANHTLYLGQALATSCSTGGGSSVGVLTGGSFSASTDSVWSIASAWSNGNRTLTITLGSRVSGSNITSLTTGPWTLTPSRAAQSGSPLVTAAAGRLVCSAANTTAAACRPASGTRF